MLQQLLNHAQTKDRKLRENLEQACNKDKIIRGYFKAATTYRDSNI